MRKFCGGQGLCLSCFQLYPEHIHSTCSVNIYQVSDNSRLSKLGSHDLDVHFLLLDWSNSVQLWESHLRCAFLLLPSLTKATSPTEGSQTKIRILDQLHSHFAVQPWWGSVHLWTLWFLSPVRELFTFTPWANHGDCVAEMRKHFAISIATKV